MKTAFSIISKLLFRSCAICVFSISLFFVLAHGFIDAATPALTFGQFAIFFLFSLLLSASFFIYMIPLVKPLLTSIHCLLCGICFFSTFLLAGKIHFQSTSSVFVAIICYLIVYFLIFALSHLFRFLFRKITKTSVAKEKTEPEVPAYEKRF